MAVGITAFLGLDTKNFSEGAGRALKTMRGIGISAGAISAGFISLAKSAADSADQIDRTSQTTGIAVDEVQKLNFAASQNKSSAEELERALVALNRRIQALPKNFERYGIAIKDANGENRKALDVFFDLADFTKNAGDQAIATAAADDLLSEAGRGLLPTLQLGADGLRMMGDEAERLGQIMEEKTVKGLAAAKDELDVFINRLRVGSGTFAGGALRFVDGFIEAVSEELDAPGSILKGFADTLTGNKARQGIDSLIRGIERVVPPLKLAREEREKEAQRVEELLKYAFRNEAAAYRTSQAEKRKAAELAKQAAIVRAGQAVAEVFRQAELEGAEKVAELEKQIADARMRAADELLSEDARVKAAEEVVELEEKRAALLKKQADEAEKIARLQEAADTLAADLTTARSDRGSLTVAEIAAVNKFDKGVSAELLAQVNQAREVLRLGAEAEAFRSQGQRGAALETFDRADELRRGLSLATSAERESPLDTLKAQLKAAEEALELQKSMDKSLKGKLKVQ